MNDYKNYGISKELAKFIARPHSDDDFPSIKKAGQKRRDADDAIIESAAQLRLINESVARAMADSVRVSRQARLANWIASGSLLIALASLIAAVLALLK